MEKIYKKDIDKIMPILQALEKGKTIQFAALVNEWVDLDGDKDGLLLETLINNPQAFRVKPEPKYRPFKDTKECWEEMQKHHPFGWVNGVKKVILVSFMSMTNKLVWEISMIAPFYWLQKIAIQTIPL
jgi:hypothetical protein